MDFGPKRGHWLFIFENFFKDEQPAEDVYKRQRQSWGIILQRNTGAEGL